MDEQGSSGNFELMGVRLENFDFFGGGRESRRISKESDAHHPSQIKVNRAQLKTS